MGWKSTRNHPHYPQPAGRAAAGVFRIAFTLSTLTRFEVRIWVKRANLFQLMEGSQLTQLPPAVCWDRSRQSQEFVSCAKFFYSQVCP
jgi:hypothetical protein